MKIFLFASVLTIVVLSSGRSTRCEDSRDCPSSAPFCHGGSSDPYCTGAGIKVCNPTPQRCHALAATDPRKSCPPGQTENIWGQCVSTSDDYDYY